MKIVLHENNPEKLKLTKEDKEAVSQQVKKATQFVFSNKANNVKAETKTHQLTGNFIKTKEGEYHIKAHTEKTNTTKPKAEPKKADPKEGLFTIPEKITKKALLRENTLKQLQHMAEFYSIDFETDMNKTPLAELILKNKAKLKG